MRHHASRDCSAPLLGNVKSNLLVDVFVFRGSTALWIQNALIRLFCCHLEQIRAHVVVRNGPVPDNHVIRNAGQFRQFTGLDYVENPLPLLAVQCGDI
ncbi:MAG: hypothetical protein QOH88_3103 [Verrucomicrobiota bacterium]